MDLSETIAATDLPDHRTEAFWRAVDRIFAQHPDLSEAEREKIVLKVISRKLAAPEEQ